MTNLKPIKKKLAKENRKVSLQDPSKLLAEFFNDAVIKIDEPYANDLGEPTAIKSSSQIHLDDAWDKWHDLQLEGWTFEELELPESV